MPKPSVTFTLSKVPSVAPMLSVCAFPALRAMFCAAAAVAVAPKNTVGVPLALAEIESAPAVVPLVQVAAANPPTSLLTPVEPAPFTFPPPPVIVNVTVVPETALPN